MYESQMIKMIKMNSLDQLKALTRLTSSGSLLHATSSLPSSSELAILDNDPNESP